MWGLELLPKLKKKKKKLLHLYILKNAYFKGVFLYVIYEI